MVVDVDADPDDDEAWTEAIAQAWSAVPDSVISEHADLEEHEIEASA